MRFPLRVGFARERKGVEPDVEARAASVTFENGLTGGVQFEAVIIGDDEPGLVGGFQEFVCANGKPERRIHGVELWFVALVGKAAREHAFGHGLAFG